MVCLGIRYGGATAGDRLFRQHATAFLDDHRSPRVSVSRFNNNNHLHLHPLSIIPNLSPNLTVKSKISTAALTATAVDVSVSDRASSVYEISVDLAESLVNGEHHDRSYDNGHGVNVSEKFDEWMRNSVTEIVKNIRQAPLLVQIYADGGVTTETAVDADDWPEVVVRERSASPDGIILVEELREKVDNGEFLEDDGSTKAFGVLIQGKFKGRDRCKSACYLLKTCSVNGGMESFCTHFCLMKVNSFGKSASSQLNDCWLLR